VALRKQVYVGRDNTFDLEFSSVDVEGVETLLSLYNIFSAQIALIPTTGATVEAEATALDETDYVDITDGAAGILHLRLGTIPGLTAGTYMLRLSYMGSSDDPAPTQLVHERGQSAVVVQAIDP
jgi:hypothetical protein